LTAEEFKKLNKEKKTGENPALPEHKGFKQLAQVSAKDIRETDAGLEIDFTISTSAVDREQDTIRVEGWELENYRKNPVVMWAHLYRDPPVAKSLKEWVEGQNLKSRALFPLKDAYRFGHMIGEMYKGGFLSAVSVGFRSIEARWAADENERPWGIDYMRQELLEYSCVPVPANPEALVEARAAGIDTKEYLEMTVRCLETGDDLIPAEMAERVYKALKTKSAFFMPGKPGNSEGETGDKTADKSGEPSADESAKAANAASCLAGVYAARVKINENRRGLYELQRIG